ncbi:MAG: CARDB domain-containing protein, partial [Pseudomonadota bacterium]
GLAGTTGLAVAAFEIVGTVFGEGQVQFLCGRSLDLLATTFGIDITGSITREQRLLEIFPGVSVLTSIPLIGDYIEGVLDTVLISGKIGGRGKFTATFRPRTGGALQFDSGTGRIGLPTNASLHVRPLENVDITVFGGGEPFVMAKVPEPNFDRAGILLVAQVQFDIYGFGDVFVQAVNCTIPGGCTVSDMANKAVLAPANWRLLPRKHLAQPDYATFAVSPGKTTVSSGDVETTLVSSTFPRTRLSLSTTGDGRRLLVYVHDDPADPAGRGTEIRSLFYDGASWQAPVQIVDDTQPEFAPQVAFDGVGNGIALWERSELSSLDPIAEFDLAFAQSLELVSSVWNGTSWSTPVAVTSNTDMDHAANIASGNDGSVLAIWKNHSGGNLLGDAANPVALSYATWSGSSWSAPQSIASGLTGLTQTTVAQRDANVASAAFIRSTGSSGFNAAEAELFLTTFDGLSWAAPQRITNDTTSDTAPALAYDSSGSRHLVWVRDGDLVWLRDSVDIADVVTIRPGSGDVGFQSFELVSDANGNLAIVWPFSQGDGLNAGYLIFDQVADQWGQAQALQDDSDIEGPVVAAFAADGSLNLAYIKTAVTLEDVEVTTPGTGTFTAENVPTEGASDLAYLEHPLGIDATVSLIDLTPGNVLPNQDYELAVSVSNSGDFTIDSLSLEIFQNDGQILVQDVMNLAAGETRIVTFNGNLGTASKQVFRAVVDPAGLLTEKDESNNELTFQLGGPIFDAVFADGFE